MRASSSQELPSLLKQPDSEYHSRWERARGAATGADHVRFQREINKRLRCISEENEVEYGDDAVFGAGLEEKYQSVSKLVNKQLENCVKEWRRCKNLDLCFLLDGTGSMGPYIRQVKSCIEHLAACLVNRSVTGGGKNVTRFRVGAVVYRDFIDGAQQFDIIDFTDDVAYFKAKCESVHAKGGGDSCEDVFGGIEQALGMAWSSDSGTRLLVHMCDSPCHGTAYHGAIDDDHPSGDPKGRSAANLFRVMKESSIFYYFCKITSQTDQMIGVFAQDAQMSIPMFDLSSTEKMEMVLNIAVTSSLNKSVIQATSGKHAEKRQKQYKLSKARPDWQYVKDTTCKMISYEMPTTITQITNGLPLLKYLRDDKRVKVASNPFAEGTERIAYYGQLIRQGDTPAGAVLKECKYEYPSAKRGKSHEYIKFEQWLETQTIASYLAKEYMAEIHNRVVNTRTKIEYIPTRVLIVETPGPRLKYYMIEPELQCLTNSDTAAAYKSRRDERTEAEEPYSGLPRCPSMLSLCKRYDSMLMALPDECESVAVVGPGEYESTDKEVFIRFSNNADYLIDESRVSNVLSHVEFAIVVAFSHWTYERTKGYLMVVDLQGALTVNKLTGARSVMLTDPAIHCTDFERFGSTNHAGQGMQMFLQNHKCNEICATLGLPHIEPVDETYSDVASVAPGPARFHSAAQPTRFFSEATRTSPPMRSRSLPDIVSAFESSVDAEYEQHDYASPVKRSRGKWCRFKIFMRSLFRRKK